MMHVNLIDQDLQYRDLHLMLSLVLLIPLYRMFHRIYIQKGDPDPWGLSISSAPRQVPSPAKALSEDQLQVLYQVALFQPELAVSPLFAMFEKVFVDLMIYVRTLQDRV